VVDFNSTAELMKRLEVSPDPWEALREMRPGQQVRVKFAMSLKQLAMAMKADPLRWVDWCSIFDTQLDQTVEEMFAPHLARVDREAYERGRAQMFFEFRDRYPELFEERKG
jgi:hypothetical protein